MQGKWLYNEAQTSIATAAAARTPSGCTPLFLSMHLTQTHWGAQQLISWCGYEEKQNKELSIKALHSLG